MVAFLTWASEGRPLSFANSPSTLSSPLLHSVIPSAVEGSCGCFPAHNAEPALSEAQRQRSESNGSVPGKRKPEPAEPRRDGTPYSPILSSEQSRTSRSDNAKWRDVYFPQTIKFVMPLTKQDLRVITCVRGHENSLLYR